MIKAHELRIGNWIADFEAGGVFQIEEICKVGNQYNVSYFNGSIIYTVDVVDPIPLTEDWLVKLGFEKPSFFGSYMILYLNDENKPSSLQIPPLFRKNSIQICRSGICAYEAKCEYVHQLQNLYFALTGEELEMKGGNNE